jgi:hypothetical protein
MTLIRKIREGSVSVLVSLLISYCLPTLSRLAVEARHAVGGLFLLPTPDQCLSV